MKNIREEQEMQDRRWWDTIVDAMAKALFVSAYAGMIDRYCEDNDCSYNDLPNNVPYAGAGEDWMDNHPPVSDEAKEEAYNIARQYESLNKKSIDALLEEAAEADGIWVEDIDSDYASEFGHYLGMMALGLGVSWFDDHEKFPLQEPNAEFHLWPEDFGLNADEDDDDVEYDIEDDSIQEEFNQEDEIENLLQESETSAKPLKVVATEGVNNKYGGLELMMYVNMMKKLFSRYPYDMFVIEYNEKKETLHVRLAGYSFETDELNEDKIVYTVDSLPVDTIWFKVDDYGDYYVGTFLFPDEY